MDLPYDAATYMHRVGRTGRFGTHGVAVTFVSPPELQRLRGFLQDVAGGQVTDCAVQSWLQCSEFDCHRSYSG